ILYIDITRTEDGTPYIAASSYVPTWVRNRNFTIIPVADALQEQIPDLRTEEITRMRQVQLDVTHMFSAEPIEELQSEYPITRERFISDFPGLPLWGSLPWR
ncbi:MAG: hypothetical protein LBI27_06560, partial [Clostridiales bacterium]|nr:hypothetical protein [Clostridiales bacterium]